MPVFINQINFHHWKFALLKIREIGRGFGRGGGLCRNAIQVKFNIWDAVGCIYPDTACAQHGFRQINGFDMNGHPSGIKYRGGYCFKLRKI